MWKSLPCMFYHFKSLSENFLNICRFKAILIFLMKNLCLPVETNSCWKQSMGHQTYSKFNMKWKLRTLGSTLVNWSPLDFVCLFLSFFLSLFVCLFPFCLFVILFFWFLTYELLFPFFLAVQPSWKKLAREIWNWGKFLVCLFSVSSFFQATDLL